VVSALTRAGFLIAMRGRSGGLRLARPAAEIRLGDVVRATEPDFALVECFATGNPCVITGCCRLPRVLNEALGAFLQTLWTAIRLRASRSSPKTSAPCCSRPGRGQHDR
jgi:Rrf2 family nitric oxide-sensitive transcriptional repressor